MLDWKSNKQLGSRVLKLIVGYEEFSNSGDPVTVYSQLTFLAMLLLPLRLGLAAQHIDADSGYSGRFSTVVGASAAPVETCACVSDSEEIDLESDSKKISRFDYIIQWSRFMIDFYQEWMSPVDGHSCPMHPSCSNYSKQAIEKHGFSTGVNMTSDRLLRCGHDFEFYPIVSTGSKSKYQDLP